MSNKDEISLKEAATYLKRAADYSPRSPYRMVGPDGKWFDVDVDPEETAREQARGDGQGAAMMWPGTDCAMCDPDLMLHLEGCPLAGQLRGRLHLPGYGVSASALIAAEAYDRGAFVATQRAISRQRLGLPIERGVS